MADTKISALTAAASAAAANEYAINEAGTSKKVTGTQIKTLVTTAPVFAAGTASANTAPKLTSGTVNTTPEAGALEYDGKVFYASPEAANRGVIGSKYIICLSATNTLTSSTAEQPLFDSVGAGTLTLPVGTYLFEALISVGSMSATSGNMVFDFLGAGTATVGSVLYLAYGADVAPDSGNAISGICSTAAQIAGTNIVTASTATSVHFSARGTFRVTGTGTLIPSGTLVTAAAAVVRVGSFFLCECVGSDTMQTVGQWS